MGLFDTPRIVWGDALDRVIEHGFPLDNATANPRPRKGSSTRILASGVQVGWLTGTDELLAGDVRWVPQTFVRSPYIATGWDDDPHGWAKFFPWAWKGGNEFRWFPSRENLIAYPAMDTDDDGDGVVNEWVKAGTASSISTYSVDQQAQRIDMVHDGGSELLAYVQYDYVYGIEQGDDLNLYLEAQTADGTGAAKFDVVVLQHDASGNLGNQVIDSAFLTSAGSFSSFTFEGVADDPDVDRLRIQLRGALDGAVDDTGTVWFRNIVLRRGTKTIAEFVPNPFIESYLLSPHQGFKPSLEDNGQRRFPIMIQSKAGSAYTGY